MIIKEYVKDENENIFSLRHRNCDHSLAGAVELYNEALRDFEMDIDEKSVDIVHYGGQRYRDTRGIEFALDASPHNGYTLVSSHEYRQ